MKSITFATFAALAALTTASHAQTLDSYTGAEAIAIATTGGGGGGGIPRTQRLVTVPTAIGPSLQGANPCNLGWSAAGSFMGGGLSGGRLTESRRCRGQEWFRFFMEAARTNPAYAVAARMIACVTDEDVQEAFRLMGQPCPNNTTAPAEAAAQPTAAAPAPVLASVAVTPTQREPSRPDWCFTRDPQVLRRAECR